MSDAPSAWREPSDGPGLLYQHCGTAVNFAAGGVQLVGKHALLLDDVAVQVRFSDLFALVGAVLALMDDRHPAHGEVRRTLLGDGDPAFAAELRAKFNGH